ncbi:MAG: PilZ domain-containing protein [Bryobacteraceae bacterium]
MAEKRRYRRYDLRLAVEVIKIGDRNASLLLQSRNISCRGILFEDPDGLLEKGQLIEFLVLLPSAEEGVQVRLHCKGTVVRRDRARMSTAAVLQRYEFERVIFRAASARD